MSSKEAILASAKLVKGILDGTMYKDDFYKDDDVTPKKPTEKAMRQQLEIIKNNVDYVKNNDKYLDGVVLNDDENSVINFSKSETIGAFLENGTKNWDNHGGGVKNEFFINPSVSLVNREIVFNVGFKSTLLDYPDYLEVTSNEDGIWSYGSPMDGMALKIPVYTGLFPDKFKNGTVLTFTVYAQSRERISVTYTI
jgi:hypothetical protein